MRRDRREGLPDLAVDLPAPPLGKPLLMLTVSRSQYGPPEDLRLIEAPQPKPGAGEILVKVHVVSVNLSDWEFMIGRPYYVRVFGLFRPKIKVLGSDVAGVVAAVGADVTKFQIGDAVFGDIMETGGGFAEYVAAPAKCWTLKPESLSFEEASTLPQTGCIAVQGIRDIGRVKSGEQVLINGAGGGTGTLAIPLAKSLGAEVTGVDNGHKQALMKKVGADHVIDYTQTDFTQLNKRYDTILDLAAYRPMSSYLKALKPGGRYRMVGGSVRLMLKLLTWGQLVSWRRNISLGVLGVKSNHDLEGIAQLVQDGTITPIIDQVLPLAQVPAAIRRVGNGEALGKIVIKVA